MTNGVKSFYIYLLLDLKSLEIDNKHLNMKSRSNARKRAQSEGGSASVGSDDFVLESEIRVERKHSLQYALQPWDGAHSHTLGLLKQKVQHPSRCDCKDAQKQHAQTHKTTSQYTRLAKSGKWPHQVFCLCWNQDCSKLWRRHEASWDKDADEHAALAAANTTYVILEFGASKTHLHGWAGPLCTCSASEKIEKKQGENKSLRSTEGHETQRLQSRDFHSEAAQRAKS